jgi:hypothetical protein
MSKTRNGGEYFMFEIGRSAKMAPICMTTRTGVEVTCMHLSSLSHQWPVNWCRAQGNKRIWRIDTSARDWACRRESVDMSRERQREGARGHVPALNWSLYWTQANPVTEWLPVSRPSIAITQEHWQKFWANYDLWRRAATMALRASAAAGSKAEQYQWFISYLMHALMHDRRRDRSIRL